MTAGSLWGADNDGYFWSTVVSLSELHAYSFHFDSEYVYPSSGYGRFDGLTVWNIFLKPNTYEFSYISNSWRVS